jgi:hypothetical protein
VLPPLDEWLTSWIESDVEPAAALDSFNGFFHHLKDAWRRQEEHNVMLVHYADLLADLDGEMRRLSAALGMDLAPDLIEELAKAASFDSMRANSDDLAPDPSGVFRDKARFFRSGRSGTGAEALDAEGIAAYFSRAESAAPSDLLDWLHRT